MKNAKVLFQLSLLPALLVLFSSCDRLKEAAQSPAEVNWLVGTWVVDREETTERVINGAVEKLGLQGNSFKDKAIIALTKKTTSEAIAGFLKTLDNLEFKFTEDFQYSKQAIGFGGEGKPYEIINRPAPNQITISEGGENRTYTKDGGRIWYEETIPVVNWKAKIFLRKK